MPAAPEPESEPAGAIALWRVVISQQLRSFQSYGLRFGGRIRKLLTRSGGEFDWKEIAANLRLNNSESHESFWNEIHRVDSGKAILHGKSTTIQEAEHQDPSSKPGEAA